MAYIQGDAASTSGTSSLTLPFPSNNTSGNLLVVCYAHTGDASNDTVTDTNNTPVQAIAETTDEFHESSAWYVLSCAAGANTVTVSGGGTLGRSCCIAEYSGVAASGALDQTAVTTGTGTSVNSGSTPTTQQASELLVGYATCNSDDASPYSPTGSWTEREDLAGIQLDMWMGDQEVSVVGTYATTVTQTSTSGWTAGIMTFRTPQAVLKLNLPIDGRVGLRPGMFMPGIAR